jgi:tetratricopeptide (TPR) repeat protein
MVFLIAATTSFAQKDNRLVRQGNKEYDKENYTEAETDYLKALDVNHSSVPATYNLGATRYRQDSMKQAVQNWSATALNQENNADLRSQSFYNIGNAMMKTQSYQQSIEAYKQALRLNPNDDEARYNLAYAQKMLQQQQQQQQQQNSSGDPEIDEIVEQAKKLVAQRRYQEAYDLMKAGEKKNPKLKQYAEFTNRILDIIKMNY